jgi:hypothetical protein
VKKLTAHAKQQPSAEYLAVTRQYMRGGQVVEHGQQNANDDSHGLLTVTNTQVGDCQTQTHRIAMPQSPAVGGCTRAMFSLDCDKANPSCTKSAARTPAR